MYDQVKTLQAKGNALYADGHYDAARACYSKAINLLSTRDNTVPSCGLVQETISQLLSNRALTAIQERNFAAALHDATLALRHNAKNEKAQLRKLVALENFERFEAALQVANDVLENGEMNAPTAFQYCVAARRRLRKNLAKDRQVAASEVTQMGKMVHDKQQLRINFGCLLPSQIPLNRFFDVTINIGNEFGLFQRDYIKKDESIYLQCLLRNNAMDQYAVVFEEPLNPMDVGNTGSIDATGRVKLNDHGKATFRIAVVTSDKEIVANMSNSIAIEIRAHASIRAKWNLFPVISLPILVVPQGGEFREGETGRLGVHCCRAVSISGVPQDVLLAESPGNLGIGGKLWDSCLVLTRYLAARRDILMGKQVIELGSGLGLVGIFCSLLGAHVTLTDMKEIVPLLEYNICLNFSKGGQEDTGTVAPVARAHLWGESLCDLPAQPDVIVLSDVVYDPIGYAPLVSSLQALATSSTTLVLMAYRSRNPSEHQFFDLLSRSFSYKRVPWFSIEKSALKTSASDEDFGAKQVLDDVQIFEIRRLTTK